MRVAAVSLSFAMAVMAACIAPVGEVQAAGITTLYSTGVDSSGSVLADGSQDTHYSLTQQPGTTYGVRVSGASQGNGSGMDTTKSQFIGPNSNANSDGPAGTYVYRTTFSLAGYNVVSAAISGVWSADDQGLDILLNGTSIGLTSQPNWYNSTTFKILSGFVSGLNTLDFVVRNDQGATGLRVQVAGTATAVPEPASVLLLVAGIGGLALVRRRSASAAGRQSAG